MKLTKKILSHTIKLITIVSSLIARNILRASNLASYLLPHKFRRKLNPHQKMVFNLAVTGIVVVVGTWTISSLLTPDRSEASWFNDSWLYRQAATVTNSNGTELIDFQVSMTVDTATLIAAGKMQSDCDDIRITDQNGQLLPHWIPTTLNACNTSNTKIWVRASSIPTSDTTLLLYYGNPSAQNVANGNKTFMWFDTFDTISQWTAYGSEASLTQPTASTMQLNNNTTCRAWASPNVSPSLSNFTLEMAYQFQATAVEGGPHVRLGNDLASGALDGYQISLRGRGINDTVMWSLTNFTDTCGGITTLRDGATDEVGFTVATGTWYSGKVQASGSTLTWYPATNINTNNFSVTDSTYTTGNVGVWIYNDSDIRTDWMFARKYAATEPTVTLGSEEKSEGPVLYFAFDEGTGTSTQDSSSSRKVGTLTHSTLWRTQDQCIKGTCLYFDGSDTNNNNTVTYAETSTSPTNITGDFSISVWIKPTSNYFDTSEYILRNGSGSNQVYSLSYSPTSKSIGMGWYDGAFKAISSTSNTVPLDTWSHVVVVREDNVVSFYVNGKFINSGAVTTPTILSNQMSIGRTNSSGTPQDYTGFLDELKIYNFAKTAEQIKTDYNSGASVVLGEKDDNLSNGLVGYWKMDEDSTATASAQDASGNGNAGTATETTAASGKYGNGREFDGVNDYINIPDSSSLSPTSAVTLSTWVNGPMSTQISSAGIAGKDTSTGIGNSPYQLYISSAGTVTFIITNSSNVSTSINASGLQDSTWYNITGTYDGQNMSLYINGVQQATTSIQGDIADTSGTFKIGQQKAGFNRWFDGVIDETRVYNRALSPSEIQQLYDYAPPPVAYWDFEEGSGTSLSDKSGNGNNGTWNGSGSQWTTGKYGKGGNFNGTNDYIDAADDTDFEFSSGGSFTAEAWVNTSYTPAVAQGILTKGYENTSQATPWYLIELEPDVPVFQLRNTASITYTMTGTTAVNDGRWHHIVGVVSGTTAYLYVDGKQEATITITADTYGNNARNFIIGRRYDRYFNGKIDEVKVYNYARTPSQIIEDMNAGHPIGGSPVGSMVGHWSFDEGSGITANNSGNGGASLKGTISGATWANGKFGKALAFDGTDDSVSVVAGDNSILDGENGFTYSVWMKRTETSTNQWPIIIGSSNTHNYYGIRSLSFGDDISFEYGLSPYDGTSFTSISCGNNSLPLNEWHQFTATYDGNTLSLYKDTKLCQTTTTTLNPTFPSTFYINSGNYKGLIDEVKVYNTALTEDQIKIDHNGGQSLQFGILGTEADGTPSNSSDRAYCPPGDTTATCGPIAEWLFEEGQGTSVSDTSGNNNTGTINGTIWTHGKVGNALLFDGVNDYVDIPSLNWTPTKFSLSFLLYPLTTTNYNQSLTATNGWGAFQFHTTTDGSIYVGTDTSTRMTPTNLPAGTVEVNKWQQFTFTFDNGTGKFYKNGQLLATKTGMTNPTAWGGFQIGHNDGNTINGRVDHIQIYNYALSPSQVAWNYNKGAPVAHYDFDECQGSTVHSFTKPYNPALNGTITIGGTGTQASAGTCQTSGTAWGNGASGKVNSSLSFDGTDDYIAVGNENSLNATSQVSISLWIKPLTQAYQYAGLVQKGAHNAGYYLRTQDASNISFNVAGTWNACLTTTSPMTAGAWNHVTAIYDGSNCYIYVNGKLILTNIKTGAITTGTGSLRIGRRNAGENSSMNDEPFNGQIDDIKIFNYALTPQQVKTVYNNGAVYFGPATNN